MHFSATYIPRSKDLKLCPEVRLSIFVIKHTIKLTETAPFPPSLLEYFPFILYFRVLEEKNQGKPP